MDAIELRARLQTMAKKEAQLLALQEMVRECLAEIGREHEAILRAIGDEFALDGAFYRSQPMDARHYCASSFRKFTKRDEVKVLS
jgi:hypothetical protein